MQQADKNQRFLKEILHHEKLLIKKKKKKEAK
jgi:hypothetical protein